MEPQTGDKNIEKGSLVPLSEHPQMDRLVEILEKFSPDRQEAFGEWLENKVTNEGEEVTHDDSE
jgi:hypothetical protein